MVAAHTLSRDDSVRVTVIEAASRVGGQVAAIPVPGSSGEVLVDVGAESVHLGAPHVAAVVRELGLADDLIAAAPGASLLKVGRRLVPLPAGVGPTGPTQVGPVVRSRILSLRGLVRAGLEPLFCRRIDADISVGAFVSHRFGREVTETFVDPLLGNLHSGTIHGLSLQATAPQLVPIAREGRSLLVRALRPSPRRSAAAPGTSLPMFASWPEGLTRFTDALAGQSRDTVRTGVEAHRLERVGNRWLVRLTGGEVVEGDAVVLTTGVPTSTALLRPLCPEAATALDGVRTATVATVVLGYDRAAVRDIAALRDHNGLLLSSRQAVTVKAMTNLGRKWPTRFAAAQHHVIRVSVGSAQRSTVDSLDDQQIIDRCVAELEALIGLTARPEVAAVVRWNQSMPQLAPGHFDRVARARTALAELPGLFVAGGPWDGLGLGNTVASGQKAAASVLAAL